jgi:hypothetical protein
MLLDDTAVAFLELFVADDPAVAVAVAVAVSIDLWPGSSNTTLAICSCGSTRYLARIAIPKNLHRNRSMKEYSRPLRIAQALFVG